MTYKIAKTVVGYESQNTVLETGLLIEDAKAALSGHKKTISVLHNLEQETEMIFSFENENNAIVTYSIESEDGK